MTSFETAVSVIQKLRDSGFEAYLAGGCVRDRLLGRDPLDHDVATNAVPDQVQKLFRRTVAVGKAFGVIIVLVKDQEIEVATFRSDAAYSDGRHPDAVTFSDLKSDVWRRDFTINGMMEDPLTGQVVDLVGGRKDLDARIVRAIGEPDKRFDEDRLRMLRAVRFAAQLEFEIEGETLRAVQRRSAEVSSVSRERVREELEKILRSHGAMRGLGLLRDTGLLRAAVPALADLPDDAWRFTLETVRNLDRRDFPVSMAAILQSRTPQAAEEASRDLKLSNDERERVVWLVAKQADPDRAADMKPSEWKPLLAHPGADDLLELYRAKRVAAGKPLDSWELLRSRRTAELDPPRLISGDDLMAMGVPRGPKIGELLAAVRKAQLDGEVSTAEGARQLVEKKLASR